MSLFWLRRPHVPLLVLLVVLLGTYPLIEGSYAGRWLYNLLVVGGVLVSLHRVHVDRSGQRLALALGGVALVTQALHWFEPMAPAGIVSALAQAGFYYIAALLQVRYILRDSRATVDELYSAAVAFLLLALAWTATFWSIEYFNPGSFQFARVTIISAPGWYDLFYFSVTSLSTTGYGDIVPVSSGARAATSLEQIAGVLYVALIIARLASFAGPRSRKEEESPS